MKYEINIIGMLLCYYTVYYITLFELKYYNIKIKNKKNFVVNRQCKLYIYL